MMPSTDFVLQQSFDLTPTGWTTLTNTLTLNFTILQYQIILSPPAGNGFYQLKTP